MKRNSACKGACRRDRRARNTARTALAATALGLTLGYPAHRAFAADPSTLGSITLRPTISSIGVTAALSGDDDGDAKLLVSIRKTGDPTYLPAHPLLRVSGPRGLGSVFFLDAASSYDVKVTLDDPDNTGPLEGTATITTRADGPATPTGQDFFVDAAGGDDSSSGTQQAPFATIQKAASVAGPGATVHVAPGVYRETVTVSGSHGGTSMQVVRFLASPGAVVDGSDPALESGSIFVAEGGGLYSAPFNGSSQYVAVDDVRLYDYPSLAELQAEAAGLPGGFFADGGAGRIYIKLPDGSSPAGHTVHVAVRNVGFLLDTVTDVVVEGFEIRYLGGDAEGAGVDVRDTSRAWVRKNSIHHMNAGVRIRRPMASDNVIEDNQILDTSVYGWPWGAVKAHTPEASAISVTGGGGNVVRRNWISGSFNGVYVGAFGDSSEAIAPDTDVHENTMIENGDDGLEPEGACVNVRFWKNVIRRVYNGISIAPIEVGPAYFVRNLIDSYGQHALKVNNGPTGWMLFYHTTSVPNNNQDAQAMAPTLPFSNFITRNNIWAAHRYVIESAVTPNGRVDLDYDNLYTDDIEGLSRFVKWLDIRYDDLAALKASGTIEGNGFQVTPAYEDPANGDFTPVLGNGVIDVGVTIDGINDQFIVGGGPDLGAFERGGEMPAGSGGAMPTGTGTSSGTATGSGGTMTGAGGGAATGSAAGGAGQGGSGASQATGGAGAGGDEGGCGCRMAGAGGSAGLAGVFATLAALAIARRRRNGRTLAT
jgi:MYXO-CTERM domain-containing protein